MEKVSTDKNLFINSPVNQGNDDVFHINILMKITTRLQKVSECLDMVIIRKHLKKSLHYFRTFVGHGLKYIKSQFLMRKSNFARHAILLEGTILPHSLK